jgi:hypothetical protein
MDAHQGLVRCGRCQAVFNATDYLQDDQPSPQLDLPIAPERTAAVKTTVENSIEISVEPSTELIEKLDFSIPEPAHPESQVEEKQDIETKEIEQPPEPALVNVNRIESSLLAQTNALDERVEPANPEPVKKKNSWLWFIGSLLLLIVLLAQAVYYFRIDLAANQPSLKPALISYCQLLQCTVPLPQKADLMSIESSELEADPAQSSVITLNALLRNHAPYTQAFPDLELTLTDAQDKPLARRTFRPAEYLKTGDDEKTGLSANRELGVKLTLDTTDLKPSGYRLLLFYPQNNP